MPTYTWHCDLCGYVDAWRSIHDGPGTECPQCFGPATVVLHPPVLLSDATVYEFKADRRLGADRDAYLRMRREGLQPKQVTGSAELERCAETKFEIESGTLYPGKQRKIEEGQALAAELGLNMERQGLSKIRRPSERDREPTPGAA